MPGGIGPDQIIPGYGGIHDRIRSPSKKIQVNRYILKDTMKILEEKLVNFKTILLE